jgi:hypothetical protein
MLDAPLTSCACAIPPATIAPMQTEPSNIVQLMFLDIGVPSMTLAYCLEIVTQPDGDIFPFSADQ